MPQFIADRLFDEILEFVAHASICRSVFDDEFKVNNGYKLYSMATSTNADTEKETERERARATNSLNKIGKINQF